MTITSMIYGAYGYSGELIARLAVERGLKPILAGRHPGRLIPLAEELELEHKVFKLEERQIVEESLEGIGVVLHCAGPFAHTFRRMSNACLRNTCHYLDITGEAEVFEGLAALDEEAREAGVMLMPGVGFDVVPSDCQAVHLKELLPSATHLSLAFTSSGGLSRGTATTMTENIHRGGLVRRDGKLTPVPTAWRTRQIDFGRGPRTCVTIPWGDVATAFYSTGIPNIEVYLGVKPAQLTSMRITRYLAPLLGTRPIQAFLKNRIRSRQPGPTPEQRERGKCLLWGEATDDQGGRAVSRLTTPDGYTLTAHTAVAVLERVLAGDAPVGYQTAGKAYGGDFVLGIEGVERRDGDA